MSSKPYSWPPQPHRSLPDEATALRAWRRAYDAMVAAAPPVEPLGAAGPGLLDVAEFSRLRDIERTAWDAVLRARQAPKPPPPSTA